MGRAKSSSALSDYKQLFLVHEDLRLTYQILNDDIKFLNNVRPYLDCEIECRCGKYHHHLSFKRKTENQYICPDNQYKILDLKKGVRIR